MKTEKHTRANQAWVIQILPNLNGFTNKKYLLFGQ